MNPSAIKKWEVEEISAPASGGFTFKGLRVNGEADQANFNSFLTTLAQHQAASAPIQAPALPLKTDKGGMLADRIDQFIDEQTAGQLSGKNIADFRFVLKRLLLELCGNKPLNDIDSDDADVVMKALMVWPANAAKKSCFKGMGAIEIIAKNVELKIAIIEPRTVEKNLDRLRRFFNWADERSYLTGKNPFEMRRLMTKDKREAQKKTRHLTI